MPVFVYKGIAPGNRAVSGVVDAENARAARSRLRADGIFPTRIEEGEARGALSEALSRWKLPELRRVPGLDRALFTRQLATMIAAGVPLVESLSALTQQVENRRLKAVIGRVRESVYHGQTLADSLAEHGHVFD